MFIQSYNSSAPPVTRNHAVSIGFVILSHGDAALLRRLVDRLNILYEMPPIACHHDFSQAPLDTRAIPGNVRFVEPAIATGWGKLSVVTAGLAALRLLVETADPDWFVLLSATDYPVRAADLVRAELASSPYDAYIDAQCVRGQPGGAATFACEPNPKLSHFSLPSNVALKWQFYVGAQLWVPMPKNRPRWRIGRVTLPLPFAGPNPFGAGLSAYYGDHWFTANRRAMAVLLEDSKPAEQLRQHLVRRAQADECYYQTILGNTAGLNICRDNKRYAEWNGGGAHPVAVEVAHVPAILASGAHFARKFALHSPAIEQIDATMTVGSET
ncbi:beta-1,6-N-acetylglucosaminyltransferase [Sphingomonas sp. CARO-RG-8B-R24-01]|uniref:beta-1,6-N-acetylglucosaminyltransferase n=1 Tax=Sphingomonas sp. CARO-RG-8B-R24-01 TaxID=2914831 RepID=UPI001F57CF64